MATSESQMKSDAQAPPVSAPSVKIAAKKSESLLDKFLGLLSSVRFGIVMLSLLLCCCLIGMVVMQVTVQGFQRYYEAITPAQRAIFGALGFFDIYHSRYFAFLLAITGLNIILASIDRFPTAWQYVVKPKLTASPKFIAAQTFNAETYMEEPPGDATAKILNFWKNHPITTTSINFQRLIVGLMLLMFIGVLASLVPGVLRWLLAIGGLLFTLWFVWWGVRFEFYVREEQGRTTIFGQTLKWNRLGAYVVHVALLTIFTGGFWTYFSGVGGSMEIRPGKSSDQFMTIQERLEGPQQGIAKLPFQIECRDIQQKLIRSEGGLDAQNTIDWLSYITIVDKDARKDMLVHLNNVGDYRGYRFFQSQFLPIGNARTITVSFEPVNGGEPIVVKEIPRNGSVDVPGIGNIRYVDFFADFEITESGFATVSRDYNKPVAQLEVTGANGQKQVALALGPVAATELLGKANEKAQQEGVDNKLLINGYKVLLKDFEKVSYTHTLTIQYDPGRTPVYIGFTLLSLALSSVFFFSHQRIWAVVEPDGKGSKVFFGGNTNRNRAAFESRFESLTQALTGGGEKDE
jgi:cytochrome c biogenesis protein